MVPLLIYLVLNILYNIIIIFNYSHRINYDTWFCNLIKLNGFINCHLIFNTIFNLPQVTPSNII